MSSFDRAFEILIGHEGGFTDDPRDAGNWTGGAPGQGALRGTRWGISAAAYPHLDIATLTLAEARAIYRRDYWDQVLGEALPPPVALLAFDAAVNCGVRTAIRWLQAAVGATPDGIAGPRTRMAAAQACATQDGRERVATEMLARRNLHNAALRNWGDFGLGWSRRLFALPFQAMRMEEA
jgi:lysozyme family protein